ncbi:E3 ubiquitin-protein ligase Zswim2-like [Tubulanus polymorphus]|uniref:E3 ubiquitin-protein ligase Zswim2-like n=1 Tax=Tubulanus polymorphus TaxID=672921 RepID=UPI003DA1C9C7
MARNVSWRKSLSDAVSWRQDQALNETIYILRNIGPTGFLIKEEGENKKFKVLIGDPHQCTCPVFLKEKDLCKHICWILLRKYRVPRQNPVTWQLGLVEREIGDLLQGIMTQQIAKADRPTSAIYTGADNKQALQQREILIDDVCPICQDELLDKHEPVTYCKYGCGNSIHIKCMKVWADHQRSTGETIVKCPFCREDFGPFDMLKKELANSSSNVTRTERLNVHLGIVCKKCHVCPILGKCYKCHICAEYYLCQSCFNTQVHSDHSFQFRQKTTQRWRPAPRSGVPALPEAVAQDLMNRDLTNNDYDLLLQLDCSDTGGPVSSLPEHIIQRFPMERVREASTLLLPGKQCCICLRGYQLGEFVRKLPCRHKFHRQCIDEWLMHKKDKCPIDGQLVWSTEMEEQQRAARRQSVAECRQSNVRGHTSPSTSMLNLEIPGISIAKQQLNKSSASFPASNNPNHFMQKKDIKDLELVLHGTQYSTDSHQTEHEHHQHTRSLPPSGRTRNGNALYPHNSPSIPSRFQELLINVQGNGSNSSVHVRNLTSGQQRSGHPPKRKPIANNRRKSIGIGPDEISNRNDLYLGLPPTTPSVINPANLIHGRSGSLKSGTIRRNVQSPSVNNEDMGLSGYTIKRP